MAQNRRRACQNFEKKNWRGASRDSFFLEILLPWEPIKSFGNASRNIESFENYEEFWKNMSYNFQSRKQILTLRGLYTNIIHTTSEVHTRNWIVNKSLVAIK